ncbi:hypothetical protein BGZ76_007701 [Entomortierella beljakovae]|nr:hypothetical protein BGZ76_007701 [Entomortierella beljakovae]
MTDQKSVSQYYRKKLEQYELNPEEWSAVRYSVIKHTAIANGFGFLIAAATTFSLGTSAFFFARSHSWSRGKALSLATVGNIVGLGVGGAIAMESGMKTIEDRLQGSGSELLYLMDRYAKATMRERLGDKVSEDFNIGEGEATEDTTMVPRMIRIQDPQQKS